MKKIRIITLVIFIAVFALVLATNMIHWDETPLEQSIAALPLGLGFLLELPFLILGAVLTGNGSGDGLFSYDWQPVTIQAMPLVAGAFYSGLFYLVATRIVKRTSQKV